TIPEYRRMPLTDLATDARIVVGAQATAYPLVLMFIFMLARTRTHERFRDAIRWNWPGISAPGFFVIGAVLAVVVEGLSHFLPIPKSLPMDKYFHDASSAYIRADHRRRADGRCVCRHPRSPTGLCLGTNPEHLRGWRGLHSRSRAHEFGGC